MSADSSVSMPEPASRAGSRRGPATRYDKTPQSYLAGLHLRGTVIRLRNLR